MKLNEGQHNKQCQCNFCFFIRLYNAGIEYGKAQIYEDVGFACDMLNLISKRGTWTVERLEETDWRFLVQETYKGLLDRNARENHNCL